MNKKQENFFYLQHIDNFLPPPKKREKKKNEPWRCNCLTQYCLQTTLHGFKYLAEPGRTYLEKIFWLLSIIGVYYLTSFWVLDLFTTWIKSPVILSFSSEITPVSSVPFPAITICGENQIRPSVFNFTEALLKRRKEELSEQDTKKLNFAVMMCIPPYIPPDNYTFDQQYVEEMEKLPEKCENVVNAIRWLSNKEDGPCQHTQTIYTRYGLCYSFNLLPIADILRRDVVIPIQKNKFKRDVTWSLDDQYFESDGNFSNDYPRRASGSSLKNPFELSLLFGIDYDRMCSMGSKAFNIIVHNPAEMPYIDHSFFVQTNKATVLKIVPQVTTTDIDLLDSNPELRGCYMTHERPLRFFKIYTSKHCHIECEANISLSNCGCVAYYHPRVRATPVCGPTMMECVEAVLSNSHPLKKKGGSCDCLPSCTNLKYKYQEFSRHRDWDRYFKIWEKQNSIINFSYAHVSAEIKDRNMLALERIPVFSMYNLVSDVGGLLSSFIGFSFISLFEILYFVSLNILTTNMINRQNSKVTPDPKQIKKI